MSSSSSSASASSSSPLAVVDETSDDADEEWITRLQNNDPSFQVLNLREEIICSSLRQEITFSSLSEESSTRNNNNRSQTNESDTTKMGETSNNTSSTTTTTNKLLQISSSNSNKLDKFLHAMKQNYTLQKLSIGDDFCDWRRRRHHDDGDDDCSSPTTIGCFIIMQDDDNDDSSSLPLFFQKILIESKLLQRLQILEIHGLLPYGELSLDILTSIILNTKQQQQERQYCHDHDDNNEELIGHDNSLIIGTEHDGITDNFKPPSMAATTTTTTTSCLPTTTGSLYHPPSHYQLKQLRLQGVIQLLTEGQAQMLANALQTQTTLTHLTLSNIRIYAYNNNELQPRLDWIIQVICNSILPTGILQHLELSGMTHQLKYNYHHRVISSSMIQTLCDTVIDSSCSNLRYLEVSNLRLDENDLMTIAHSLYYNNNHRRRPFQPPQQQPLFQPRPKLKELILRDYMSSTPSSGGNNEEEENSSGLETLLQLLLQHPKQGQKKQQRPSPLPLPFSPLKSRFSVGEEEEQQHQQYYGNNEQYDMSTTTCLMLTRLVVRHEEQSKITVTNDMFDSIVQPQLEDNYFLKQLDLNVTMEQQLIIDFYLLLNNAGRYLMTQQYQQQQEGPSMMGKWWNLIKQVSTDPSALFYVFRENPQLLSNHKSCVVIDDNNDDDNHNVSKRESLSRVFL